MHHTALTNSRLHTHALNAALVILTTSRKATKRLFLAALLDVFMNRPTTMLPFLYQTRTLSSLCSAGKASIAQYRYVTATTRRHFSKTITRLEESHEPGGVGESSQEPHEATNEGHTAFRIRRVASLDKQKLNGKRSSFSYGARTADSHNFRKRTGGLSWKTATGAQTQDQHDELDIPWEEPENTELDDFDEDLSDSHGNEHHETVDEIENLTRRSGPRPHQSTITPSERVAFQKIFSDIFARSQSASGLTPEGFLEEKEMKNADEISTGTAEDAERPAAHNQKEVEAAVNRYPPALRAAAARAMGLKLEAPREKQPERMPTPEAESEELAQQAAEEEKLEQLRKPERDRVEGLMRAAQTDFELWAVMEKEVFPLISKLGLESPKAEEDTAPKKKGRKKTSSKTNSSSQKGAKQTAVALDSPVDGMTPLEFYGPLYPSYILLGLRLLDRSFARPSSLARSVLPTIKSLGLISHILGGTSQLYNELILIHWYRYDDFRGVLSLLSEMEQFGLSWDRESLDTVKQITRVQKFVREGNQGMALKALWSLPEFAPGRFVAWQDKIERALAEAETRSTS